jgi:hypothetical protein
MYAKATRLLVLAGVLVVASLTSFSPALAQLKIPSKTMQEVLIKTTLLTFNDANVTGNYAVLHAKGTKPFRDQFPPERLKEVFKAFVDNHIDFDIIAAKTPQPRRKPRSTTKACSPCKDTSTPRRTTSTTT